MARTPRQAPEDRPELLPADDTAAHITQFFQSIGDDGGVTVSVYQVDPKERMKRSFLFALETVQELTGADLMAQVLEKFGPGEYIAEGRDANNVIRFCPRFRVGPLKGARAEIPDPRPAAAPAAIPTELAAMLERNTRALEALVSRPAPSLVDQLKELAALREFIAPPAAPPAAAPFDFSKMVELVKDVLTLRDTLGDAAGVSSDSPLAVLARSLAPALTKIAERAVEPPPALPRPPAAAPSVSQEQAAPSAEVDMSANGIMLKAYVAELVRFAEQGIEPRAAADRVLQTLAGFPEPMQEAAFDWLNDEAAIDNLAALEPRAAQYRPWLTQVVDMVLDAMSEPEEEAPAAPAGANGTRPAAPPAS